MKRYIQGEERSHVTLLPACLDDYIAQDNTVRIVYVFVDALDLASFGFDGITPAVTGRPSYHPSVLLMLYICGYLNRIQSSRRLERECQRNVELMWLTGRLAPDFKTIADFRKDNSNTLRFHTVSLHCRSTIFSRPDLHLVYLCAGATSSTGRSTASCSALPSLKCGTRAAGISTGSSLRGLRSIREARLMTEKLSKPLISMRWLTPAVTV